MNDFMTWQALATYTGAVAATTLIAQFFMLKSDKVFNIPARFIVYIIALIILFLSQIFSGIKMSLPSIILTFLNGIVVAMASIGTYEVTFRKIEDRMRKRRTK